MAPKLPRDIGTFGLLFASVGSIIGAGWLFGALYASSLARPAAVISWLLGGGALMLLALTHAELGGMYPVAGGAGLGSAAVDPRMTRRLWGLRLSHFASGQAWGLGLGRSGGKSSYSGWNGRPRLVREGREQAFASGS